MPYDMKQNLLYEYSEILAGKKQKMSPQVIGEEYDEKFTNTIYLIRFALKDILRLKTREEAKMYFKENPEDLKTYLIKTFVKDSKNIRFMNVTITDYDFVFRYVYDEIKSLEDVKEWAKDADKRTREKVFGELKKLGVKL